MVIAAIIVARLCRSVASLPSARKNDRVASASLRKALIGKRSFAGPRPDVSGYADKLVGEDWDVLKLRPGITGPATLKYRLEDVLLR